MGTALRAASVASAPSRPMSSAGGWMPRAMSRSSAMASLAPRWASSTSSRTWSRSTWSASSSFSLAMPRRMARATSWAWVPSCRSRSMRRSVAAEASTVWVRACSSVRTRVAMGSGPSRPRIRRRSTLTKPRMTHGAARKKMPPRRRPRPVEEARWLDQNCPAGTDRGQTPNTARPPPSRLKTGSVRQAKASHHRLTATKTPRKVQGTLMARYATARQPPGRAGTTAATPGSPGGRRRARGPRQPRRAWTGPGRAASRPAAGAAQGEGQEGEAEEGDGQHHAGEHGEADEREAQAGQAARHEEEGQFGPGPLGEGLAPDALRQRLEPATAVLLADGQRELLPPMRTCTPVSSLACCLHQASRWSRTAAPTIRATAQYVTMSTVPIVADRSPGCCATTAETELPKMNSGVKRPGFPARPWSRTARQRHAGVGGDGPGGVADDGAQSEPEQGEEREEDSGEHDGPQHAGLVQRRRGGATREDRLSEEEGGEAQHLGDHQRRRADHEHLGRHEHPAPRHCGERGSNGARSVLARHGEHAEYADGERAHGQPVEGLGGRVEPLVPLPRVVRALLDGSQVTSRVPATVTSTVTLVERSDVELGPLGAHRHGQSRPPVACVGGHGDGHGVGPFIAGSARAPAGCRWSATGTRPSHSSAP